MTHQRIMLGGARPVFVLFVLALTIALNGCSSAGIALKERFGYAKREQLVDRVQDARDEQVEAKDQFNSALKEFIAVTEVEVSELEAKYDKISDAYEESVERANRVHDRIEDVEQVAELLFEEWEEELDEYTSSNLRRASEQQLSETRRQYDRLLQAMKKAESTMEPVLATFKDHVLFLKHNLNAQAIASLQDNVAVLQVDVQKLIRDMEASIAEANTFIEQMRSTATPDESA